MVVGYEGGQKAERIALTELPDEKHQEALAVAFEKGSIQGYNNLIDALKRGYAAIGYEEDSIYSGGSNAWPPEKQSTGIAAINAMIGELIAASSESDIIARRSHDDR